MKLDANSWNAYLLKFSIFRKIFRAFKFIYETILLLTMLLYLRIEWIAEISFKWFREIVFLLQFCWNDSLLSETQNIRNHPKDIGGKKCATTTQSRGLCRGWRTCKAAESTSCWIQTLVLRWMRLAIVFLASCRFICFFNVLFLLLNHFW